MSDTCAQSDAPDSSAHVPKVIRLGHDFRHIGAGMGANTMKGVRYEPSLRTSALGTWVVCGLPAAAAIAGGGAALWGSVSWTALFAAYGAALTCAIRYRRAARPLANALL